ncbi:MAG: hypothetical protein RL188_311, partial [Bacteroidota bacterium]
VVMIETTIVVVQEQVVQEKDN